MGDVRGNYPVGFFEGGIFRKVVIFARNVPENVQGNCPGGCPDPRASLQISMCSSYDLGHRG